MKATRVWHCSCCDEKIQPGEDFKIVKGDFLKVNHPKKKIILIRKMKKEV